MLHQAQHDHPDAHILIKTHPDTQARHRAGHFARALQSDKIHFVDTPISPWVLFQHARAVYTVSSQMGFEAILAGHRPVTFGAPFYAGWGLSDDRGDVPARRNRALTALQLAAATLILYPKWYDPYRDCLCSVENVIQTLAAQARAWREDRQGYTAYGMRYWKRRHLNNSFGRFKPIRFAKTLKHAAKPGPAVLVWARHASPALEQACADAARPLMRVEDGFLRSRGLGAALTPALSFVKDASGIYYDPTRPSDLETQIATIAHWPHTRLGRAKTLLDALIAHDVTKYNLPTGPSTFRPNTTGSNTTGPVILVPGQVEDDASVMLGGGDIRRNLDLLKQARHLFPDGYLIYKPHPDVEAGLRHGAIAAQDLNQLADHVAHDANPADLMRIADHVVTITSTMGFEALLRGIPVTTLGVPFYAGWGLTTDLGPVPARRTARPSRAALVQAVLIEYPRYFDPVTGLPCPVEIVVDRLTTGKGLTPPPRLRWLSRIQGALANHSWIWR